jgi:uncharacterized protein YndB with AHSA1/START domain
MQINQIGEYAPKDLRLDVIVDAPRAAVWRCWTEPELLQQWFCPKPWRVSRADLDVRPGGRMNTVMEGPGGERHDNVGIFLEVDAGRRLTFTDGYSEGFVPAGSHFMTGYLELADTADGKTHIIWGARHGSDEDTKRHLDMGFVEGWTAVTRQLEDLAQALG